MKRYIFKIKWYEEFKGKKVVKDLLVKNIKKKYFRGDKIYKGDVVGKELYVLNNVSYY